MELVNGLAGDVRNRLTTELYGLLACSDHYYAAGAFTGIAPYLCEVAGYEPRPTWGYVLWVWVTLVTSLTLAGVSTVVATRLLRRLARSAQFAYDRCLRFLGTVNGLEAYKASAIFNSMRPANGKPSANHTHGAAAADRTIGAELVQRYARRLGLEPYSYQMSKTDQRAGMAGSRVFKWSRDVDVEPRSEDTWEVGKYLTMLVDVDYYLDMPQFLLDHPGPVGIYTLIPEAATQASGEMTFCFTDEGKLRCRVSGGAEYEHHLWDYGRDTLFVQDGWRSGVYSVQRQRIAEHRYVVLLYPIRLWGTMGSLLSSCLSGHRLERLNPLEGAFVRLRTITPSGLKVSTAVVSEMLSVTMTEVDDDACRAMVRIAVKNDVNIHSYIGLVGSREKAAVMVAYYRETTNPGIPATVVAVNAAVRRYQADCAGGHDDQAKPTLVAFMSPLVHGCFAPDQCLSNEQMSIDQRVKQVAVVLEPTAHLYKLMVEFVSFLIPVAHLLHPVGFDEVAERQSRPAQRVHLQDAVQNYGQKRAVRAFMKKEAYQDVKPPRNISTMNDNDKLDYSCYIYPFMDEVVGAQPWYASSLTPIEISERVATLAYQADSVEMSDCSKFDGRVSGVFRELEDMALKRAFQEHYVSEIDDLHHGQYNLPGTTTLGVRYQTGTSRASGSLETGVMNTLCNAFMHYVARRSTPGYTEAVHARSAYESLGLYCGDDGVTADLDPHALKLAGESVGQCVTQKTASRERRFEVPLVFLSRHYSSSVWDGAPDSCCDISRQLSKLHTTTALPPGVTPAMKLIAKAESYFLSDPNTPVVGELCRRVLEVRDWAIAQDRTFARDLENQRGNLAVLRPYSTPEDKSVQYPNKNDFGWMDTLLARQLPSFSRVRFGQWLASAHTFDALLSPPLFSDTPHPTPASIPVIVDGSVLPAKVVPVVVVPAQPAQGPPGPAPVPPPAAVPSGPVVAPMNKRQLRAQAFSSTPGPRVSFSATPPAAAAAARPVTPPGINPSPDEVAAFVARYAQQICAPPGVHTADYYKSMVGVIAGDAQVHVDADKSKHLIPLAQAAVEYLQTCLRDLGVTVAAV